jgi:hypothetical protein
MNQYFNKEEEAKILESVWEKPVITFYKERFGKPERKAFSVVKARRLMVSSKKGAMFSCIIEDFFPLMGEIDYISTKEGKADRYVLCWFDDSEDDFGRAFRRLSGATFPEGIKFVTDKKGKRTYNVSFEAERGKLK